LNAETHTCNRVTSLPWCGMKKDINMLINMHKPQTEGT